MAYSGKPSSSNFFSGAQMPNVTLFDLKKYIAL
jgi:hypothetical protein